MMREPAHGFNSVSFVAAGQVLLRPGLEIGFVPAVPLRRKPGMDSIFFSSGAWQAGQSTSGAALIF
jgi:hypothetical protein